MVKVSNYLFVQNGSKYWRMGHRFAGKRKTLALGVCPEISLAALIYETMQAKYGHRFIAVDVFYLLLGRSRDQVEVVFRLTES